jgi:hypothetical protein
MSKYDEFAAAVETGARSLAKDALNGFPEQVVADTQGFLDKIKDDLKRWTDQLALKKIDEEDFRDLVQAKAALAEIRALRECGVELTQLERFRSGLIELVINSAFDTFL